MDILKRSGLLIPKKYYNSPAYIKIKEHLERRTKEYNSSVYNVNIFYSESEKYLLIPRYFPIEKFVLNYTLHDHTHEGQPINITHNIKPRSKTQEKAIDYLMNHENGIIQLSPGVGKTIITIYMIASRKRKSLILVHRDSLAEQWKSRFMEFTNLQANDIARLSSNTFQDDLEKPIIIATNQTLMSLLKRKRKEFLISMDLSNIGIFVGDEVHTTIGAPTFSECSIHIPSKYTYGLSATPYRYDGNGDIIEYHLGSIFADDDDSDTMKANVTVMLLDYEIDTAGRSRYIRWGGSFQRSRYLSQLKKSKPFMAMIQSLLDKLKNERNLLCISERINLIDDLYDGLDYHSKSKFCGSAKMDTLKESVTFSTPGKCRDGVDAPWKDCVVMTSPISNIDQLTGRVVRLHADKKTPTIIDMVDYGCKEISNTIFKRLDFYHKKEWNVQYIICKNGQVRSINEEMAINIVKGI